MFTGLHATIRGRSIALIIKKRKFWRKAPLSYNNYRIPHIKHPYRLLCQVAECRSPHGGPSNIARSDDRWTTNWKGPRRERLWPKSGTIPASSLIGPQKQQNPQCQPLLQPSTSRIRVNSVTAGLISCVSMPVSNYKSEIMNTKESICHKIFEEMYRHLYRHTEENRDRPCYQ